MEQRRTEEYEIDPGRLLGLLLEKLWLAVTAALICGGVVFAVSRFWMAPQYRSEALFYVSNRAPASDSISTGDLSASRSLVDSCLVILDTRETLEAVIDRAGSSRSVGELETMISAEAVRETEILRISVAAPDPMEAWHLAKAVAAVLPERIGGIMEGVTVRLVESPVEASAPSSPETLKHTLMGILTGFLVCAGLLVVLALFDDTIRSGEDVAGVCDYPVLATVPEGCRLLADKLLYLLPEHGVIGFSGEAGDKTAEALAEALSQRQKRVLLLREEGAGELETLKKSYDYILLELPPMGVSAAAQTDGVVLLVRQKATTRKALADAAAQLEFFDARIMGIVLDSGAKEKV